MTLQELLDPKNQKKFVLEVLESKNTRMDEPFNHAEDFDIQLKKFKECKPTENGADALIRSSSPHSSDLLK